MTDDDRLSGRAMETIKKDVGVMTPTEYRACYLANYGDEGCMRDTLVACRLGHCEGSVIMLWDGPDDSVSSLIGWVLLTKVSPKSPVDVSRVKEKTKSKYTAQFWVKRPYRKQGYGKMLMHEVKKVDPLPHVTPHDTPSSELFSSFKVYALKYDRALLRVKPKVA